MPALIKEWRSRTFVELHVKLTQKLIITTVNCTVDLGIITVKFLFYFKGNLLSILEQISVLITAHTVLI